MGRKKDVKLIDYVQRRIGLSVGQRQLLHDEITGRKLSKKEIIEIAKAIKREFPGK